MDKASVLGIISGLSLIIISILLGGDLITFFNLPGLMIVVGGTLAAVMINFRFEDVKAAFKSAVFVFSSQNLDPNEMIATMVELCTLSRRHCRNLGKVVNLYLPIYTNNFKIKGINIG